METSFADPSDAPAGSPERKTTAGKLALFAPLVPLVVLAAVYLAGGLDRFDSADEIAEALRALRDDPFALAYVLLGYGLGTMLFMPITALIAGTLLAFEPVRGFFYAFFGVQLAATTTYYCGRLLGGRALDHLSGPRIRKLQKLLQEHAVRASAAARALPVGNFTLLNWLIGGLRVPFRWFILGNALGTLPGLLVLAIFANRLASALKDPKPEQIALLIGVGIGFMLFIWLASRLGKRFAR
ncbi:MAG TPA: VTT domain-containing protein [Polyangiales bacterium]|nr:VTT domain-containing protein [Polyangiales bacterium]